MAGIPDNTCARFLILILITTWLQASRSQRAIVKNDCFVADLVFSSFALESKGYPAKTTLALIIRCAIASFGLFVVSTTAMSQNRVPLDTIVILQNGNCEMGCPVYRIAIFADGDVLFQGRSRGRKTGAALTHISGDRLDQILEKFKQLDYTHVENTYGLRGTGCSKTLHDEPIVLLSLSAGGFSKTVAHYRPAEIETNESRPHQEYMAWQRTELSMEKLSFTCIPLISRLAYF